MFGWAISSCWIPVAHYKMESGTVINYKNSSASCTFCLHILWQFMWAGGGFCFCLLCDVCNCWLNHLVQTVSQFRTFMSSLKMGGGGNGCIVRAVILQQRNALEGNSVSYRSAIWAQPVQSGPFAVCLARAPAPIWQHNWTLYSSGRKCTCLGKNCFSDSSLARHKASKQNPIEAFILYT